MPLVQEQVSQPGPFLVIDAEDQAFDRGSYWLVQGGTSYSTTGKDKLTVQESTEDGTLKTVEDLLRARGETIKTVRVTMDGDIEYDPEKPIYPTS
jgi:hypothetical protein